MLSKLLLSLSLAVAPIVSVSAQAVNTFDTYQTADKYLADFDYLNESSYRITFTESNGYIYKAGENYRFYVFPIYYELKFTVRDLSLYYENDYYQFVAYLYNAMEVETNIEVLNYIGVETKILFLALDYIGMSQVIEHDKAEKFNSISIYNSFYKFFTGFFPNEVVAEYHGIFTFVIVAFLLFLVFGFVFFLFRVIRRLVGFK